MKRSGIGSFLVAGAAVAACAVAGGAASDPKGSWYRNLDKPVWNPPDKVFPVVWTALYGDIALSSGRALADLRAGSDKRRSGVYLGALGTNLALNAGWSYVFFRSRNNKASTLWAGALAVSSADLVRRTAVVNRSAGAALAPYVIWTAFAAGLAATIWRRNS